MMRRKQRVQTLKLIGLVPGLNRVRGILPSELPSNGYRDGFYSFDEIQRSARRAMAGHDDELERAMRGKGKR